ncbi:MAG TPA: hypothetical protein VF480_00465 [Verrucomicrobiae bacterium]
MSEARALAAENPSAQAKVIAVVVNVTALNFIGELLFHARTQRVKRHATLEFSTRYTVRRLKATSGNSHIILPCEQEVRGGNPPFIREHTRRAWRRLLAMITA